MSGFKVGAVKKKITPIPEMGPVYRAGYKMGEAERITDVVDDLYLRCLTIEGGDARVVFLSLDLIGLFSDFTKDLALRLASDGIGLKDLIVATTHVHSGPDTMGLWGPSFEQSGFNERYGEFLLDVATDAVKEALSAALPADAFMCYEEKNLGVANHREPDELSLALWGVIFKTADKTIGSLFSYTAQPELAPRHDDRISAGYPGEACRLLDTTIGGTSLFLLGTCGGMEPEGCEKGYDAARTYGRKVADELVSIISTARKLAGTKLAVRMSEVELPVENPGFHLMMETGVIRTSQKPPSVAATISRIDIGEVTIFTLPGEAFPGIVSSVDNQDKSSNRRTVFINQVNDSLGYFIPPEQFRPEPVEWAEGHHFTGHELESLGPEAGRILRDHLLKSTLS